MLKYKKITKLKILKAFLNTLLIELLLIVSIYTFTVESNDLISEIKKFLVETGLVFVVFAIFMNLLYWWIISGENKKFKKFYNRNLFLLMHKMDLTWSKKGIYGAIENRNITIFFFSEKYEDKATILISGDFGRGNAVRILQKKITQKYGSENNDFQVVYGGVIKEIILSKINDWNTINWENEISELFNFANLVEREKE